jgi:hypothetical protein
MSEKEKIIKELNQILQVRDIHWSLLPEEDLLRLFEAFQRLKQEFEEVFAILDEILETPLTIVEDSKREWRHYCV